MQGLESSEPVEIRLDGVFDVEAARAVVRAIERTPAEQRVRIDLTRVREFHDFAVAVMGLELDRRRETVLVDGLGRHQLRVLSYLGIGDRDEAHPA